MGIFSWPPSRVAEPLRFGEWEVHIREGFPYAIAQRDPKGSHPVYEQVLESSFDPIQCALDYVSATGAADLQTLDAAYRHLVWWPEEDGLVLKVCETEVLRPAIYAEGTVLDSQGRPKPHPPAPAPRWDQSMRFYRRAQLSDDVFAATRSLWLADGRQHIVYRGPPAHRLPGWVLSRLHIVYLAGS